MLKWTTLSAAALLLAACGATTPETKAPAAAASEAQAETGKIISVQDYLWQQEQIRAGIEDGSLGAFSSDDKALVLQKQNELKTVLAGVETIDELSEEDRIVVFNAQEQINGVLQRNLYDTPICRREHTVGSYRPTTVCLTPRQRTELAEYAQEAMRPFQRSTMRPPAN